MGNFPPPCSHNIPLHHHQISNPTRSSRLTRDAPECLAEMDKYIAAGCLIVDEAHSNGNGNGTGTGTGNVPHDAWSLPGINQWRFFSTGSTLHSGDLSPGLQKLLLSSKSLSPYVGLLSSRWVRLSFSASHNKPTQGIVRVYILPDDVDNRDVPRSALLLRKARQKLMKQLDFSESTWHGHAGDLVRTSPAPFIAAREPSSEVLDGGDQSLLQMFNSIPSPDPRPDMVEDHDARDAMYNLLSSGISGLGTTLYGYQCRSAALMLQREVQAQQVLDPRLNKSVDQRGVPWYYDGIDGAALREPRYYDGPVGGILAEEMGSGKTLICLALILATKNLPSRIPDIYQPTSPKVRARIGSLADMAAACINANSVPWKQVFLSENPRDLELEYTNCIRVLQRNPGFYYLPRPRGRRSARKKDEGIPPRKVYLSHTSLIIVPPNLVQQWRQEINKHTRNLSVLVVTCGQDLPKTETLLEYDIILFSSTRFEQLLAGATTFDGATLLHSPLANIRFKRCIVDEGHRLGNSTAGTKSSLHLVIDLLEVEARWAVTGTPAKGLFGINETAIGSSDEKASRHSSAELEKDDLRRIGSIASLYLKMRPWANMVAEAGDTPADWNLYVVQANSSQASARGKDCLRSTLESLIIRHQLSEIGDLLPAVEEKVVYIDGSYQDRLVLNLFSMMIIFNAVQSQRVDRDFFFHPRQRKALIELTFNLRQASFFGGSFFSLAEVRKAVDTAEGFLTGGKLDISAEDTDLLRQAVEGGRVALNNSIKECANLFREVPIYLENFPWAAGQSWSLDLKEGDPVCTDSRIVLALQKVLQPLVDAPTSLQLMFSSGKFAEQGLEERLKGIEAQDGAVRPGGGIARGKTLAGNTKLGQDNSSPGKRRSAVLGTPARMQQIPVVAEEHEAGVAAPLAATQMISTASAKLSYLIDQVVRYQEDEQIIIFYESDNVAYYIAGILEILQIHHLIYAKGITPDRRAQYVATFNHNQKFRVLLMDITQAAFGLDMRSASRIYFVNPVLNPQVQAQAIGRARRISQKKPVTVETLVLRDSLEEMIVKRRREMSQAEQWKCRSILDDKPIYEWILNAKILPLPGGEDAELSGPEQMAKLQTPQFIFGRGFGREIHPDQDLVAAEGNPSVSEKVPNVVVGDAVGKDHKRKLTPPLPGEASSPKKKPRIWQGLIWGGDFSGLQNVASKCSPCVLGSSLNWIVYSVYRSLECNLDLLDLVVWR
ncbi:P-loop containing nucleoside triphosphate hydrolase protein [Lasiosphaeria hispida]|uniref:P-loop containing nucleoside triphosphate hydrolase protein n=1 Tax=Lasiosphaeria hispida TaxID=260671 RepID=A0AAJ0MJ96_9PEZI|nr:P-loop containing nucleoside triphosphate hydrolase protein [Lasiosphaeria hispida]